MLLMNKLVICHRTWLVFRFCESDSITWMVEGATWRECDNPVWHHLLPRDNLGDSQIWSDSSGTLGGRSQSPWWQSLQQRPHEPSFSGSGKPKPRSKQPQNQQCDQGGSRTVLLYGQSEWKANVWRRYQTLSRWEVHILVSLYIVIWNKLWFL